MLHSSVQCKIGVGHRISWRLDENQTVVGKKMRRKEDSIWGITDPFSDAMKRGPNQLVLNAV